MYQTKLKLKLWWDNFWLKRVLWKTNSQVKTSGFVFPLISFLTKATILLFFGMLIMFPFYFMISTALMTKQETEIPGSPKLAPAVAQWDNFKTALVDGYWKAVLITMITTSASIILKIFITMLMGYAFSIKNWRFKKLIWIFFLSLLMIPEVSLVFGQYKVIVDLKFHISYRIIMALIMPFIASVFSAYMFRNAFEKIPTRTREAALVDGAGGFKYFIKVAVPMVSPTTWTVVILTGFAAWNSYLWPSLLLSGQDYDVITTWLFKTGIDSSDGDGRVMRNIRLAAALLAILPMFIVYFLFRSRIMRAISRQGSAIKG